MSENIVSDNQVCFLAPSGQITCSVHTEEANLGRNSSPNRFFGNILCWFDTQNRNASLDEILKQVSVIACDFYNPASFIQSEARCHGFRISSGVFQPALRI